MIANTQGIDFLWALWYGKGPRSFESDRLESDLTLLKNSALLASKVEILIKVKNT